MFLKRDEEEILKILLKLYSEQKKMEITGSFTDFPIKYQIVYKEILLRLQEHKFLKDFEEFIAEDFSLTLMPVAINYFTNKNGNADAIGIKGKKSSIYNSAVVISELEALIELKGNNDLAELTEIKEEIQELCINLKKSPTVQPRKILLGKITKLSEKYPWLSEKISYALGLTMMDIMSGN